MRLRPANEKWCSLRKLEEDQAFTDWSSAWAWITEIDDEVTQKGCAIDLITQRIENLNTESRSAIKVDKLLNKDWAEGWHQQGWEKKDLRKGLAPYVKAAKATSKRIADCLGRIERNWSVVDRNRFYRLHYLRSSETFFSVCYNGCSRLSNVAAVVHGLHSSWTALFSDLVWWLVSLCCLDVFSSWSPFVRGFLLSGPLLVLGPTS